MLAGTGRPRTFPVIGRNTFTIPRTILDLRAQKDFNIAEKYNLQLIGEAFNLANHQNVTGISTTGYITEYGSPPAGSPAPATSTLNLSARLRDA